MRNDQKIKIALSALAIIVAAALVLKTLDMLILTFLRAAGVRR